MKLAKVILLTALLSLGAPAFAGDAPASAASLEPPDKEKVSYALGMNVGLQHKQGEGDVDIIAFTQGIQDMLEGKPTQVKESEIPELLNQGRFNRLQGQGDRDSQKLGYALGMRLGGQLKRVNADVDAEVIARGLKDVLEGKLTRLQESEIDPLFQQAKAYGIAKESQKNKTEGQAFLSKNARAAGIKVLPDGLQYRVLAAGAGEAPMSEDLIIVKYRGTFVDGKEFDHNEHFLTRSNGGMKGWQEALQRMRVGAKWQIFVPSDLAFGHEGEPAHQVGPDAALIYELELVSIARPGDPLIGTGSLGHGLDGELSSQNIK